MTEIDKEPVIRVGMYTDGPAIVTGEEDTHILHNLLIGKGYHWQRTLEARLPGIVESVPDEDPRHSEGVGLVNILPAEEYLRCVACSEMNPQAPAEFLKAHAIMARSWLFHKLRESDTLPSDSEKMNAPHVLIDWDDTASHHGFDVCSDDHCQRYQGLQRLSPSVARALDETRGIVMIDREGNVADARYSKCCGGITEDFSACWGGETPHYLAAHNDEYCDLSEMPGPLREHFFNNVLKDYDRSPEPFGTWERDVRKEEIARNLAGKFGRDVGDVLGVEILERGKSGRAYMAMVSGSEGNLIIGKELLIRRLLAPTHLYSSLIDIEDCGDTVHISGRGWGHGVGLCQIGAAHMALKGATAREILEYYYPGISMKRLYD